VQQFEYTDVVAEANALLHDATVELNYVIKNSRRITYAAVVVECVVNRLRRASDLLSEP
jgi:hypothetical protein